MADTERDPKTVIVTRCLYRLPHVSIVFPRSMYVSVLLPNPQRSAKRNLWNIYCIGFIALLYYKTMP